MPTSVRGVRFVLAIAAAAVALTFFGACERGDVRRTGPGERDRGTPDERVEVPRAVGGGPRPARDLIPVVEVPRVEAAAYAGAHVELGGVVVQSVPSDRAFWVGPSPDRQILVVLDDVGLADASTLTDPKLVARGRTVDVVGTLRQPPTEEGARHAFHLDEAEARRARELPLYVEAQRIVPSVE